jgi:manganese/zinc/iron transport system substrate-binding protein
MKSLVSIIAVLLLLAVTSCGDSANAAKEVKEWMIPNGKIKVLSTIEMISDLVKQVGKEHVDAQVLIRGELDPHSYQLVKGDDEKLAFADLVFYNGLGLEHGPSLQSYLSSHKKAIPVGNLVMKEHPELILYFKKQLDPHIWMDISLWSRTVPYIVEALAEHDPANKEEYEQNGQALIAELSRAHSDVKAALHQVPSAKRYLVTSHDAFNYFTRAYLAEEGEKEADWRERFVAPEGLAPESQISTLDIQSTINHLKKFKIHVLFPESNVNQDSIRKIVMAAKEKGIDVSLSKETLYADAMGRKGSDGDTYIKMIDHDAKTIAEKLLKNGGI